MLNRRKTAKRPDGWRAKSQSSQHTPVRYHRQRMSYSGDISRNGKINLGLRERLVVDSDVVSITILSKPETGLTISRCRCAQD